MGVCVSVCMFIYRQIARIFAYTIKKLYHLSVKILKLQCSEAFRYRAAVCALTGRAFLCVTRACVRMLCQSKVSFAWTYLQHAL